MIQLSCPKGNGSKPGYSRAKARSIGAMMSRTPASVVPHASTPSRAFLASTSLMRFIQAESGAAETSPCRPTSL
jgi:hypothetical protein